MMFLRNIPGCHSTILRILRRLHSFDVSFSGTLLGNFQTGHVARLADSTCVCQSGETAVMANLVSKPSPNPFLVVDFKKSSAAERKIPQNRTRSDFGVNNNDILIGRIIDRSIRPVVIEKSQEIQITCSELCTGNHGDVIVDISNAASFALANSHVDILNTVGTTRVGFIDGHLKLSPNAQEINRSSLNLVVTANSDGNILMLEGDSNQVSPFILLDGIELGSKAAQSIAQEFQKQTNKIFAVIEDESVDYSPFSSLREHIQSILHDYTHSKLSRDAAIIEEGTKFLATNEDISLSMQDYWGFVRILHREKVLQEKIRVDGRSLSDVRPISAEINMYPSLHGCGLFTRGQTQVMSTITLGSPKSAMELNGMSNVLRQHGNFFLSYKFPDFCNNALWKRIGGGSNRREIGHGALAQKCLQAVVPEKHFFTVRASATVLESAGSSSMATVCATSLALMDAGVPISGHAAGIAMGLMKDPSNSSDYVILTDQSGMEDAAGDMDFKIGATRHGITGIQVDVKSPEGLSLALVGEILDRSKEPINQILDKMNAVIESPKTTKTSWPVTDSVLVPAISLRGVFSGGKVFLNKIEKATDVEIDTECFLGNTTLELFAPNATAMKECRAMLDDLIEKSQTAPDLIPTKIYLARVVRIVANGVFIKVHENHPEAFIPAYNLTKHLVKNTSVLLADQDNPDGLRVGAEIYVKFIGHDRTTGALSFDRRSLLAPAYTGISFPEDILTPKPRADVTNDSDAATKKTRRTKLLERRKAIAFVTQDLQSDIGDGGDEKEVEYSYFDPNSSGDDGKAK